MPWIRFTEKFDWQPRNVRWMISYGKDSIHLVKQVVADEAIKKGKAVPIERPVRKQNAVS
jgi:hypothetical protein